MEIIIEILLIPVLFLLITGVCYYLTEYNKIPVWLRYEPFICYKCLSTWSLVGIGIMLMLLNLLITGIALIVLGILNGVAKYIDEKNNTVSIEEYGNQ